MATRVALVTGSNRGLGLGVCRRLAGAGWMVIATSRNETEGREAVARLRREKLDVLFEALDVTSDASVARLAERLAARGDALDVLVNNAGVSLPGGDFEAIEQTVAVNYTGALRVTDMLGPALRDDGGIVMVSTGMAELAAFPPVLRERFLAPGLDRASLGVLVQDYLRDSAAPLGQRGEDAWPSAYRVSKAALNALTRVLAVELAPRRIKVNAVCPGWVRTDMGGAAAPRSLDEGVESIAWAALLDENGPTGGFFRDGKQIPW